MTLQVSRKRGEWEREGEGERGRRGEGERGRPVALAPLTLGRGILHGIRRCGNQHLGGRSYVGVICTCWVWPWEGMWLMARRRLHAHPK